MSKNGVACVGGADCVSGVCAQTLASTNVCCATACPGASCSSDGSTCVQCEGAGAECVGNTSRRCQNGQFVETACGNGCDPATGVCAGLLANAQACTANAQCASAACGFDVVGAQRCCTPGCAATGRVCGTDGSCVCPDPADVFQAGQCRSPVGQSCVVGSDCSSGACQATQSGGLVCCTGACNGQICRANGQGCVQCEGGPAVCQGATSQSCVGNAFVFTNCGNGCNPATGLCNSQLPLGSAGCTQDGQCAGVGSSCQGGRCCESDCSASGRVCSQSGLCQCAEGTTTVGNTCLLTNGQDCDPTRPGQCASGRCDRWFRDSDGDSHGDPNQSRGLCGTVSSAAPAGFVLSSDDCCDTDNLVNPDQRSLQMTPSGCGDFDYNCSGEIEYTLEEGNESGTFLHCDELSPDNCPFVGFWEGRVAPSCGQRGLYESCSVVTSPPGTPPRCANVSNPAGVINACM